MKHKVFYINSDILIKYLQKYSRGVNSKDYEFAISIHAKDYWEKKTGQKFIIVFEQNNKMHNYPERFTPNLQQLKEILTLYNEENTPVDFALAPITSGDFEGYAYPFQVKKFTTKTSNVRNKEFAEFINKKANNYRTPDTCLIIIPQMMGPEVDTRGLDLRELKSMLKIDEESVRAIYIFQFFNYTPKFIPIWISPKALAEDTNG